MNRIVSLLLLHLILRNGLLSAAAPADTVFAVMAGVPVVVDGSPGDDCWGEATWKPIGQVWIPYGAKMAQGDFQGRFKVSWDRSYLYLLVEIVDDMLSDDHPVPTQNWWDDDCVEVFVDEDRSQGNHERNNNAFAYHVSLFYDAIDLDANGNGVNYKNNLKVVMDTIGDHTYLWEMAIKIYGKDFSAANPENSRIWLTGKKLMGFVVAYCDNDKATTRENFIGSVYMTEKTANDNYITADYFGPLLLVDRQINPVKTEPAKTADEPVKILYDLPRKAILIEKAEPRTGKIRAELRSVAGVLLRSAETNNPRLVIHTDHLPAGIYIISVLSGKSGHSERISVP